MPKYNVFDEFIDEDVREKHDLLAAQTRTLINAANILSDAMTTWTKSQKELSQHLGLSKGYVSRLLSGTENISLKNFAKILHMLGYELSMSALKTRSDEAGNIIWMDFGKTDSNVSFECSTAEVSSPWADILKQKAI